MLCSTGHELESLGSCPPAFPSPCQCIVHHAVITEVLFSGSHPEACYGTPPLSQGSLLVDPGALSTAGSKVKPTVPTLKLGGTLRYDAKK